VIEIVLEILERLPIDREHLEECDIARKLSIYAKASKEIGMQGLTTKATHLLQRWQVTVFQLSYEYDKDEVQQKELK